MAANAFQRMIFSLIIAIVCAGLCTAQTHIGEGPHVSLVLRANTDYILDGDVIVFVSLTVEEGAELDCNEHELYVAGDVFINNEDGGNPENPPIFKNYEDIIFYEADELVARSANFGTAEEPAMSFVKIEECCGEYTFIDCHFNIENTIGLEIVGGISGNLGLIQGAK